MSVSSPVGANRRKTVSGPAGVLGQLRVLTSSDLRSRYGRGRWQLVKWLIDPFALVGVYLLMVTFIFYRRPHDVGLSLACSIIPFQLVSMTVQSSLDSVRARQAILANMRFRRYLLPLSTTLTETCGLVASLTLLALMIGIYGATPSIALLWLPVGVALTILLGVAVAYPVTLVGVWAPDARGLMMSAVRSAYYLAPGLVTLQAIHGRTNGLVRLNPLTGLFELLRHAVLYRSFPPAWELLVPSAWSVVLLAVFVPIYQREQRHFAKVLE
jgi:lipopolysaccharide transport system permease protein